VSDRASLVVTVAVEGNLDQAVLQRLVEDAGATLGAVHGRRGKRYIKQKIHGFNSAARFSPWIVLVDLDEDANCAPELRGSWLPEPVDMMLFRVAVREIEAWLFGDPERLAEFLHIARSKIPSRAETIMDAKRAMVDLGRTSRSGEIREDLVPRSGSGRTVGVAYSSRLAEFVLRAGGWRPEVAASTCDSLDRLMRRLTALVDRSGR
jgi:hypothetical protein